MKKLATSGCAATLLLISGIAVAGSESGLYVGGSLGTVSQDISTADVSFDDDDTGYKIFAGYNLGLIPLIDLAIEGSYVDLGKVTSSEFSSETTAWTAFGLAGFKLGPIGLFGKLGMIAWDSKSSGGDDSGSDPAYGVGASIQLGSIALRAEYELFETDSIDIDYFSVGAAWTF